MRTHASFETEPRSRTQTFPQADGETAFELKTLRAQAARALPHEQHDGPFCLSQNPRGANSTAAGAQTPAVCSQLSQPRAEPGFYCRCESLCTGLGPVFWCELRVVLCMVHMCLWCLIKGRLKSHGYDIFLEGVKNLKKKAKEHPSIANRALMVSQGVGLRSKL